MDLVEKLVLTLTEQNDVLEKIHDDQLSVRKSVTNRDWESLQAGLIRIQGFADKFNELEKTRVELFVELGGFQNNDIYSIIPKLPKKERAKITDLFHSVRQKLLVSKIENDSLNEYIRVTKDFLQDVFDKVMPQRRNVLYSSSGALIKNQPDSMVLNTVF